MDINYSQTAFKTSASMTSPSPLALQGLDFRNRKTEKFQVMRWLGEGYLQYYGVVVRLVASTTILLRLATRDA